MTVCFFKENYLNFCKNTIDILDNICYNLTKQSRDDGINIVKLKHASSVIDACVFLFL